MTDQQLPLPDRIKRSVIDGPILPRDDRDRRSIVFRHLILHFRPTTLPRATLRYTHTFGLGGMSLVLFLLLVATGILLMFTYEPTPERAYASLQSLHSDVYFGELVRSVHHWSADLLIVVMLLHLLRVFFTGGHQGTRQFNWVIGLTLLLCVLVSSLTGYLLPWDQLAYWATTIVTGMVVYVPGLGAGLADVIRGGPQIGAATLINFYTLHTTIMPVCLVALMGWHFWRVRKSRGVVVPRASGAAPVERPERVLALPHLFVRELAVAMCLIALVLMLAVYVPASLGTAANPGMSPNPAKAPWYFVGFQELLLHVHPAMAVLVIPLLVLGGLLMLPYLRYDNDVAGVFMVSPRGRRLSLWSAILALVLTPAWVIADERISGAGTPLAGGALPLVALVALLAAAYMFLHKRLGVTKEEGVQAGFVLLLVGFIALTVIGVWFRGEGMALVWPS